MDNTPHEMDTQAVLAWLFLFDDDGPEVVTLTEAGRAALDAAPAEEEDATE